MDGEEASSGGIDCRVKGKISFGSREPSVSVDLTDRVHLLPCVIKHDGACPVSQYFKPGKSDMVADGSNVEEAFFRGRKLHGVTVPIPNGYRGYVLEKNKIKQGRCSEVLEGHANNWASTAEFQNITYWNHDSLPSKHDLVVRSFHWFAIAEALHKPITENELASVSTIPDT
ncbi:ribonuclease H2 subunit C [Phalaenopsis equestris]|uniref:ribonuclease H2 subunit C n=1 Tax=Phalaenopsis equestris TaxID=78828 RepID=UPI0009E1D64F|nr:ribonuclease H2 subunit C [Phalaenopsis equestris]